MAQFHVAKILAAKRPRKCLNRLTWLLSFTSAASRYVIYGFLSFLIAEIRYQSIVQQHWGSDNVHETYQALGLLVPKGFHPIVEHIRKLNLEQICTGQYRSHTRRLRSIGWLAPYCPPHSRLLVRSTRARRTLLMITASSIHRVLPNLQASRSPLNLPSREPVHNKCIGQQPAAHR